MNMKMPQLRTRIPTKKVIVSERARREREWLGRVSKWEDIEEGERERDWGNMCVCVWERDRERERGVDSAHDSWLCNLLSKTKESSKSPVTDEEEVIKSASESMKIKNNL